ncbi:MULTISPECIES: class I SAM-dependent rRNA methyltransferase [Polyangium]|uniref:Class I SAM-dependent rRNA methyltransferase n=2 Tax=Polyangium TaxID=55 RepID=A0A4U1JDG8_9BACT|nr:MULTISPECIES: class I SAM-dependent rRNA methyltransferase [Polyangium]MDI1429271.1 class I SAM-dependent rRNA methyltransferase [Polyangium sorediatum]TKD08835.1 class I SAM-dependent rRNA methyltransferase [Polyangium fumosum]
MNARARSAHAPDPSPARPEGRRPGSPIPVVTLKPGHVRPVWTGHPWVFAQAIARIEGGALPGDEVKVIDPHGATLGHGLYTPRSAIPVRIYTRDDAPVDGALFRRRIERAIQHRRDLGLPNHAAGHETTAYRLIHAEGDGLPGLVVDVLGDVAVVQIGTIGVKRREGIVFDALSELLSPRAIVDRTSVELAKKEGFEAAAGVVRGDTSVDRFSFVERGLLYEIPLALGQKTGFYLDQRTLRARVEQLAHGRRVLDAFSFVGTFAMAAARGGAKEVVAVDESALAIEVGAECARKNGLLGRIHFQRDDARQALSRASAEGGFDIVLCDPPKLSPTRGAKEGALGVYKALASAGCRATKAGGILVLSSCSSAVSIDDLTRALALGAREARMHAVIFDRHFQGADHPVSAAFPEGLYLKSVIARLEVL